VAHRLLLLRGTFAPEAEWTKEGSFLRKQVGCYLGKHVTFDAFGWTGGNSYHDRDEASRTLLDKIRDCSKQTPSERLYLVAHSQGGNVALKALSAVPEVQAMVSGVVCISTPFIHVERRRELDFIIFLLKGLDAQWLFWLAVEFKHVVHHAALVSRDHGAS
jgi:pimeloyl-ACP methyl ester carboxylesterase